MSANIPITDSDRADIVRMLGEHKTYGEIADWIGCNESTVRKHAKLLGVRSMYGNPLSNESRQVTEEQLAEIRRLLGEGRSYRETAEALGLGRRTVERHAASMGVRSTHKGCVKREMAA